MSQNQIFVELDLHQLARSQHYYRCHLIAAIKDMDDAVDAGRLIDFVEQRQRYLLETAYVSPVYFKLSCGNVLTQRLAPSTQHRY